MFHYSGASVYVSQTSPYAAPSTSSSNIYSTPYEQTQQVNSQFASPPAYDNSAYTNQDNSAVDRKFWFCTMFHLKIRFSWKQWITMLCFVPLSIVTSSDDKAWVRDRNLKIMLDDCPTSKNRFHSRLYQNLTCNKLAWKYEWNVLQFIGSLLLYPLYISQL